MGGRGKEPSTRQITMDKYIKESNFIQDIKERRLKAKEKIHKQENALSAGGGGNIKSVKILKKCVCCNKYSLHIGTEYEECSICGWIDDEYQNKHPDSLEGKNPISLNEYKKQYFKNQK